MYCKCPEGYTGVTCDIQYDSCYNHDHVCLHGSKCIHINSPLVKKEQKSDQECMCDCIAIENERMRHAGLCCNYPAAAYCEKNGTMNLNSFCTNGGACVDCIGMGEV